MTGQRTKKSLQRCRL